MENNQKKSTIFLKILVVCLVLFLGLAFYGYKMLQDEKQEIQKRAEAHAVTVIVDNKEEEVMPHPTLEEREPTSVEETTVKEIAMEQTAPLEDATYIEPMEVEEVPANIALEGVPKEEIYEDKTYVEEEVVYVPQIVEVPVYNEREVSTRPANISLGRRIN